MFGLGFGEFVTVLLVAMIVLGPRELPRYLRKAGQFAGKVRRLAYEMREKSGIDEVLRTEGLDRDIAELRRLTRVELASLTGLGRGATTFVSGPDAKASPYAPPPAMSAEPSWQRGAIAQFAPARIVIDRTHEYPSEGADAYGALPDTAVLYQGPLAASPLAEDALYTEGQEAAPPPAEVVDEAWS